MFEYSRLHTPYILHPHVHLPHTTPDPIPTTPYQLYPPSPHPSYPFLAALPYPPSPHPSYPSLATLPTLPTLTPPYPPSPHPSYPTLAALPTSISPRIPVLLDGNELGNKYDKECFTGASLDVKGQYEADTRALWHDIYDRTPTIMCTTLSNCFSNN